MSEISRKIVAWYQDSHRILPFRQNSTPYKVWVSEIMAQQTRIEAMLPKYTLFMDMFPDVYSLAGADEQVLQKVWQGLGYYARARNMQKCAKLLVASCQGQFPKTKRELMQLPGIGDYTAGAIASICFSEKVSAVDGNVIRVFSRLYCLDGDVFKGKERKALVQLVEDSLPEGDEISFYNQGLMELGALVCTPGMPKCEKCPLSSLCRAHAAGTPALYPVKSRKKPRKIEQPHFAIWVYPDVHGLKVKLIRRPKTGLLAGLYGLDETVPEAEQIQHKEIFIESRHVFTHIEWQAKSTLYFVKEDGRDFYYMKEIEERLSVPSAFAPFLAALKKKEEEIYAACRY